LAGQHVPHIVIFCVQVTSFRNFNNKEKSAMKKELQRFGRLSQFTIVVVPVATFIDTIANNEVKQAEEFVSSLVKDIFEGSGAEICEALSTSCKPGEPAQGIEQLRARIHSKVGAQISSTEFRRLWCLALTRQLQNETQKVFEDSPHHDSEWKLFGAAYRTSLQVCGKEPLDSNREPKPRSADERPPWWILSEVPLTPCSWRRIVKVIQKRLLPPSVYLFCCLLLVLTTVYILSGHGQSELTRLRAESLLWHNRTSALEKALSPMQHTISQLRTDKSQLQDALTRTRAAEKQANNESLLWQSRTNALEKELSPMQTIINQLQTDKSGLQDVLASTHAAEKHANIESLLWHNRTNSLEKKLSPMQKNNQ